jgi:hypothetical protein
MRHLNKITYLFFIILLFGLYACDDFYDDPYAYSPSQGISNTSNEKTVDFTGEILSTDSLFNIDSVEIKLVSEYYYNDTITSISNIQGKYTIKSLCFKGENFEIFLHDKDSVFTDTTYSIEVDNRDFVISKITTNLFMSKN